MKADASRALLREAQEPGYEARAASSDHAVLKLWLRLLACTTQIESEIRRRLLAQFGAGEPPRDRRTPPRGQALKAPWGQT